MSFFNTYKRLDKLCCDLLNDKRGLSAYIDIMLRQADGAYYVNGWAEDLKALKHYRWVRTQIAHEPDVTENELCDATDEKWLITFHNRILQRTDPLALYRRAKRPAQNIAVSQKSSARNKTHIYDILIALIVFGILAILAGCIWLSLHYST